MTSGSRGTMRIGINGMGRMGRLALRAALGGIRRASDDPRQNRRLDIVHVNELKGGAAVAAHLLEFDSIHSRWHESFQVDGERGFMVGGTYIGFSDAATPDGVEWGDLGCEIVLECTGKFLKPEQLEGYFRKGVKRVIVAAPVKDNRARRKSLCGASTTTLVLVGSWIVVIWPWRMPIASCMTLTTGARQLVVQDAAVRMRWRSGS